MSAGLISWQEELDELQAVVDAERDKFSQQRETVQREMTTKVTEVERQVHFVIISPYNDLISVLEQEIFAYEVYFWCFLLCFVHP